MPMPEARVESLVSADINTDGVTLASGSTDTFKLKDGAVALIFYPIKNGDDIDLNMNMLHYYKGDINTDTVQKHIHLLAKGLLLAAKEHTQDMLSLGLQVYMSMQPDLSRPMVDQTIDMVGLEAKGTS